MSACIYREDTSENVCNIQNGISFFYSKVRSGDTIAVWRLRLMAKWSSLLLI